MTELHGLMYPRMPTGAGSILPSPPWHYSGEMLTIEFRTDPAIGGELLPPALELADDDPGAVAFLIGDFYRQVGNSMHGGTTVWAGPNPMTGPPDAATPATGTEPS